MSVNFDVEKINNALEDFSHATGIHIDLRDANFLPVSHFDFQGNGYCDIIQSSPKGKKACANSDFCLLSECKKTKSSQTHICHAGLTDVAVPIISEDEIIGYLIFGQMKNSNSPDNIYEYMESLGLDGQKMTDYYSNLPLLDTKKINSVSNIAVMLIKFILFENLLKRDISENIQRAVTYINENLNEDLSVKTVSEHANISKSVLYKNFHQIFHCTLSEYINKKRIEKSTHLLANADLSIDDISQQVGFSSASYYSKIFKKQVGISPLKYRKNNIFKA